MPDVSLPDIIPTSEYSPRITVGEKVGSKSQVRTATHTFVDEFDIWRVTYEEPEKGGKS